jgi:hypothetical protein
MDAKQILNSWQRTNQPETNIADAAIRLCMRREP